uniref:Dynein light chain n=1 Tax=Oryza glumipatula TaxID=40148 RepID=A0A0D9YXV4_9ORYZ
MREQEEGGLQAAGRRGGVVRALLGLGAIAEGAAAAEGGVPRKAGAGDGGGEERKAVVRVVAADMPPALQRRAFRCARDELAGMPRSPRRLEPKRLALALKKEFDTAYGPAWHCIVGTSFGSYVTHARGGFLYFSVDKVYILLFRTAVEPQPHCEDQTLSSYAKTLCIA